MVTVDAGYVVYDKKSDAYFIGYNKWDSQLRKAKIYHSPKYAKDTANDSRFKDRNCIIYPVGLSIDKAISL